MAFGLKQLSKPTPATPALVFKVVLYTALAVNVVLSIVTEIPEPIKVIVGKYSIEAVALVHAFSSMFGIPIPDTAKIQAKDVADLKTDNPTITK